MQIEDISVEIRDRDMLRQHTLPEQDLVGAVFTRVGNGVGAWRLVLPATIEEAPGRVVPYPPAEALRQPGAGIIVTIGDAVFVSGPLEAPLLEYTDEHPRGQWTFEGPTDEAFVEDPVAFPDPSEADPGAQSRSNDVQAGPAESLLKYYVRANVGEDAVPERACPFPLVCEADTALGPTVERSPRFTNLLAVLQSIAAESGWAFDVVQQRDPVDGERLVFRTRQPRDLRLELEFDTEAGNLDEGSTLVSPPMVTRVIVGGQGEGTERQLLQVTTLESESEEELWMRRRELFLDQRQTDSEDELIGAAKAELVEALQLRYGIKLVLPAALEYSEFDVMDQVRVVLGAEPVDTYIATKTVTVTTDGVRLSATVGNPQDDDVQAAAIRGLQRVQERLSALETADANPELQQLREDVEELQQGYRLLAVVAYTSSGVFEKADYPGMVAARFRMVGGGGGGSTTTTTSRGRGGGGAGGYAEKLVLEADLSATETITVGAGGSAASSGGNTVAVGITCYGGQGAGDGGGSGGDVSGTADLAFRGSGGGSGSGNASTSWSFSGQGGDSPWGGGGRGRFSIGTAYDGQDGSGYGAGGAGGSRGSDSSNATGGAGAPGRVEVEVYA